ncbi:putative thiol methyltransferase 2-like isoform X3 [Capsicum annuum]|nr:putative thiol methyltransferase 2-like isoform X3 [Capsicum annuum]
MIGGWDKCWEKGVTPWDLGQPTPILVHLHQTGTLPKGRALVPGCGSGHDVAAIACPERFVVGLDVSENAIKQATKLCDSITFKIGSFFCAIEPEMRPQWASRIRDLLKPDGELFTLIFPLINEIGSRHVFAVLVETSVPCPLYPKGEGAKDSLCCSYEEVLHPMGFRAELIVENHLAIPPRRGKEKLGRWKRSVSKSLL